MFCLLSSCLSVAHIVDVCNMIVCQGGAQISNVLSTLLIRGTASEVFRGVSQSPAISELLEVACFICFIWCSLCPKHWSQKNIFSEFADVPIWSASHQVLWLSGHPKQLRRLISGYPDCSRQQSQEDRSYMGWCQYIVLGMCNCILKRCTAQDCDAL